MLQVGLGPPEACTRHSLSYPPADLRLVSPEGVAAIIGEAEPELEGGQREHPLRVVLRSGYVLLHEGPDAIRMVDASIRRALILEYAPQMSAEIPRVQSR